MTARRPILLVGAAGQIGKAVAAELARTLPEEPVVSLARADVDFADEAAIRRTVRMHSPWAIVNAAAYTAVDRAESDRALCFAVNATAPAVLAEEAARSDSLLIHYSTDYVFDGSKGSPYMETDGVRPLNVYGESKAAADRGIEAAAKRYVILRTSWVYSTDGSNFFRTIVKLAAERDEVRVVNDQIGSPTAAGFVATATVEVLRREMGPTRLESIQSGLYHLAASGQASWFEFAVRIISRAPRPPGQPVARALPVPTSEWPAVARRPAYSVLDSRKLQTTLGLVASSWEEQVDDVTAGLARLR
jgi:dTDP-4-dehydrorhamnose reductase